MYLGSKGGGGGVSSFANTELETYRIIKGKIK
jgi:hypothetical protein